MSFRLLFELAEADSATLSELNDAVELTRGAIYNHLATLEELDVVTKRNDRYYVCPKILTLGEAARRSFRGADVARRKIQTIANTTGESASVVVWTGESAVVLDSTVGALGTPSCMSAGDELPLHSTAAGKVILSRLDEPDADRLCEEAAATGKTAYSALLEEIKTVRAQGLAYSRGEFQPNQYSVAAPVVDSDGSLLYVITVYGLGERLRGKALQQDIAGIVVNTVTDIQNDLLS